MWRGWRTVAQEWMLQHSGEHLRAAFLNSLNPQGETALVDVANAVWRRSPQRAAMAVDRLMTLRLVSAEAIIK